MCRLESESNSNLILHAKLITLESLWSVPLALFDVKLLLPFIPSHSLGKFSSILSHPVGSRCYCFWISVLFWWNTHRGTKTYFSLKETDFGLKTAGGILSLTGCSTPTQPKRWLLPFTKDSACGRACSVHSLHQICSPLYLAPVGLPIMFLTLLTKHYLPMGSLSAQLQGGSHLSLVSDKLKHEDIFNRPFVNIVPCWKRRRVPSPLDQIQMMTSWSSPQRTRHPNYPQEAALYSDSSQREIGWATLKMKAERSLAALKGVLGRWNKGLQIKAK